MNPTDKRDELTREANMVRAKLLDTVEQLDQRRHEALDLERQLRGHLRQFAIVGVVAIAATAGGVGLIVHRMTTATERRRLARWRLAAQLWQHPERALRAKRSSFWGEALRSVALTLLTSACALPAKRLIARLALPAPPAPPSPPLRAPG